MAICLLPLTAARAEKMRRWQAIGVTEGLPSEDVLDLCSSGDSIWAATALGLCRIGPYRIERMGPPRAVPIRVVAGPVGGVYALYPDRILQFRGAGARIGPLGSGCIIACRF